MSKLRFRFYVCIASLLLPITAVLPYLIYGKGVRVLEWVWTHHYAPFWITIVFSLIATLVCFVLLCQFQTSGRVVFTVSSLIITAGSAVFAMREHNHSLLVLIFLMSAVLVWIGEWFREKLALPFYNSKRKWWESHPKSVPGVTAEVFSAEGKDLSEKVRVVNVGEEGCFVFLLGKKWTFEPRFIKLQFPKDIRLDSSVHPVLYTSDRTGVGLCFDGNEFGDWNKDLLDYLDGLRRAGYVSD